MSFKAPNNRITLPVVIGEETVQDPLETPVSISQNINSYSQLYIQNKSTGDTASTDLVLGADNDNPGLDGRYANLGCAGSGFSGASAALGIVRTVSVTAGGTGYTVGDQLYLATGDANATVQVLTAPGGVVGTVSIVDNGTNYTTGTKSTTGGTGTGCTINVLTLLDLTAQSANGTYLLAVGGNLLMGTDDTVANKVIQFCVGGTATASIRSTMSSTAFTTTLPFTALSGTAVPAGGTTGSGIKLSSTANLGIFFGSGVPTLSAAQGSLYIRTDGSTTTTRMYINTNGTTGWTNVVTSA